ncbi:ATP-binding protein, partial [Morganella morganii subsp. sibonii]
MQTIKVETTSEHLKKIAKETPIRALSELVWNGFDAKATNINISFKSSELGGIDEILVIDNGGGIPYEKINKLFGSLGGSWKKNAKKMQGNEYLHGENGQGRFKAFSLGEKVVWTSIDKKIGCFDIKSSANNLLTFDVENSTKTLNNGT